MGRTLLSAALVAALSMSSLGQARGQTPQDIAARNAATAPVWSAPVDILVNVASPRQYIGPVQAYSTPNHPMPGPPAFTWRRVDLRPWGVPANAVAVDLRGILIITGATGNAETADLGVIFRRPGDLSVQCDSYAAAVPHYMGQTMFATHFVWGTMQPLLGGQRSNMASWVPVVDGHIEWCWSRSTYGDYPVFSNYGVNLWLHAIAVPRPRD